jgi:hypothetical protein
LSPNCAATPGSYDDNTPHRASWFTHFDIHYYAELNASVRQFPVEYSGFNTGRLALVKNDKHAEPDQSKYLFTDASNVTVAGLIAVITHSLRSCIFNTLLIDTPTIVSIFSTFSIQGMSP